MGSDGAVTAWRLLKRPEASCATKLGTKTIPVEIGKSLDNSEA